MYAKLNDEFHIGGQIKKAFEESGHSVEWLAEKIDCKRRNIYDIFTRTSFDTAQLMSISVALKTNFFIHFSEICENKIDKTKNTTPMIWPKDEFCIGALIKSKLNAEKLKTSWLAKKIRLQRDSVYKKFDRPSIDTTLLLLICEALNTNFFEYFCGLYEAAVSG